MARQGGLKRNRRRLTITDLSDEQDIRVLTQNRSEGRRKRESGLFMDLHLNDPGNAVFNRVFDGDDVDAAVQKQAQRGIKRGRLSRARWPGDKNQSFSDLEKFLHTWPVNRIQPK